MNFYPTYQEDAADSEVLQALALTDSLQLCSHKAALSPLIFPDAAVPSFLLNILPNSHL